MAVAFYQLSLIIKSCNMAKDINKENEDEEVIPAPEGAKYLSDIPNFKFPVNCLFNKGKTGCGGTESVLRGEGNAIIAVPYVFLIKNKLDGNSVHGDGSNHILGFYGEISEQEVKNYISTHEVKKIIVTYNSLPKLVKCIQSIDNEDNKVFEDYFLLVDEWHCLVNSYNYRGKAIRELLNVAPKFKRVTYMTATPIHPVFIPSELRGVKSVKVEWKKNNLSTTLVVTDNVIEAIHKLICKLFEKDSSFNLHLFMNSVKMICDCFENYPEYITIPHNIVCANNSKNIEELKSINETLEITTPSAKPQKINFYTSTAFEGCDIFDENGITIIVTDSYKEHTILDANTTIYQVCGRIRNSKYNKHFFFIFNSKTEELNKQFFDEQIKATRQEIKENRAFYKDLNQLEEKHRKKIYNLIQNTSKTKYLLFDNESKFSVDSNLYHIDILRLYLATQVFANAGTVKRYCELCDIKIHQVITSTSNETTVNKKQKKNKWKDLFENYHKYKQEIQSTFFALHAEEQLKQITQAEPQIAKIYDTLGFEKIKELDFCKSDINIEMKKQEALPNNSKLADIFATMIEYDKVYMNKEITQKIEDICNKYDLRKIPITHLIKYFHHETSQPKIDGTTTRCVRFIRKRELPLD